MTFREKALLKVLTIIAGVLGQGVEGFYKHQLEQIIEEAKDNK
jgi:hypothetical protein